MCSESNESRDNKQLLDRLILKEHAIASSISPMVMMDLAGNLTYANPAALKAWGYESEGEVLNRPAFEFWESPQELKAYLEGVQSGGSGITELIAKRKDGSTFDAEILGSMTLDDHGQPIGMVASCLDVTARKAAEAGLRWADFCVQQAADCIFWIDPEGRIVFANHKACEVLEYSSEELQAMTVFDIDAMVTQEWWGPHWEAIRKEKSFVIESCHRTKTGRGIPVEISINYMTFDGKEYNCAFARNISERKEAEERLAYFSAIVGSSQDAIYATNLDGVVTFWNLGAERLYGYTAAEMFRKPLSILLPSDRSDEMTTLRSRIKDGERVEHYDTVRRRKNGTLVDVNTTISPIKNNEGTIIGASAIAHEITNRKRAADLLRENEERLTSIIHNAAESIFTMSLDGVFTFVSPVWTQLLGHDVSEVKGQQIAQFIHPEDLAECQAAMTKGLVTGKSEHRTYRIRHKDGSWRWHRTAGSLVKDRQGHPAYFVGVTEDVTERLRAEEMLRASEEKYRTYINNSPTGVFVANSAGQYVEVNASACRLLGYSEEELTRTGIPDVIAPEDVQSAMAAFRDLIQTGSTVRSEYCFVRKDGSRIFMSVDAVKVQEERAIGFCVDITNRMNAEQSLRQSSEALLQANQRLEEACCRADASNRAKSEFLANMSHEIRTPMTAIIGYADVLLDSATDQDTVESVQIIKRNGHHLLGLINDILDLSKIEAGKHELDHQACSPRNLVSDVISTMQVRADAKGLPLAVEYGIDIPSEIRTDPVRLRQILVNLVGNAIKFTETGIVRVVVQRETDADKGERLRFDIIDTGIGIADEHIAMLFRPFSQVDASAHRRFGGSGLGLAISKRLAAMLGGDVAVSSVLGKGSSFSLSIATGPLDDTVSARHPANVNELGKNAQSDSHKLNCHILLAEDGPDNQRLIAFLLRKAGAHVTVVEDGQKAVDLVLQQQEADDRSFDLILMDMQMPVMDGYEATEKLREIGYQGPILALTAHAMKDDRQKCLDAGCDDYLTKPVERQTLLQHLSKYAAGPRPNAPKVPAI